MELRQLEYFMKVCEELHFTRAAEKLNITQPSLSQQIGLLEHEVGTLLFDRVGKKIVLTEAGRILREHGYRVFHELTQARAAIGELQGLGRGRLTIGALLTSVQYLLPPTVIPFHRAYPKIEISVLGLRTGDIYEGLLRNELDLGIVFYPMEHPELENVLLCEEELVLAVPADSRWAEGEAAEMRMLKEAPSVLLPGSYRLRQLIDGECAAHGFRPKPVMELTTLESLLHMVAQGIGVTVLPLPYLLDAGHPNIRVLPFRERPTRRIGIAYRRNKHLCAASRTFIGKLTEAAQQQGEARSGLA
ncbi:DNA-binding transcriptional LysR family regulator [Paenibacillus mucilaginosus]|uniref:LysR family transcriptional regulator n=1 Tax=Paenibacillus mucilaginosus TaxID=61624 RepID=UPI003D1F4B8B